MPLSESQILERVHDMERQVSVIQNRIANLEDSDKYLWDTVNEFRREFEKIRNDMANIRMDVTKVVAVSGLVQTIAIALIVYKLTH